MRTESDLRKHLGVPEAAEQVMVVAESSHWDPDWLLTANEYYRACVRPSLDRVLDELLAEPRRVFTLECIFFVDRYWRDRPGRRAQFVELVNEGRLRFSGSGVTTPDTLVPEAELILRDQLIGQEWLRRRDMRSESRLQYLPDSFGHSPGLPALLKAGGFEYAAVTRIDGMRFPGADMEPARNFPRRGSSAEQLVMEGTSDFVWCTGDGTEMLTHWMSHGYGHGDMIARGGVSRVMGLPTSWQDSRPGHIDRRVARYLSDLAGLSRTPYRMLSIGYDFVRPIPGLIGLLDAWNDRNFTQTSTWLVNADVETYMDLVSFHRSSLPRIDFDPNPYWSGFYASRPEIKAKAKELGRRLIAIDAQRSVSTLAGGVDEASGPHAEAWWVAATANHHDFVTGTSPDRVALGEQRTWLDEAIADSPWPISPSAPCLELAPGREESAGTDSRANRTVGRPGGLVTIEGSWGSASFDSRRGGAMVELTDSAGCSQLDAPALELRSYRDSGGLWRMGNEFLGGGFTLMDRSTRRQARIEILRDDDQLEVLISPIIDDRTAQIRVTIDHNAPGGPVLLARTLVHPPNRRTVTVTASQRQRAVGLTMHQPGGIVERPLERWYAPTFWPLHSFAATRVGHPRTGEIPAGAGRLVAGVAVPTAIHMARDGTAEVVVARTAVKEMAFGVVPVLAPAWGRRWKPQSAVVALQWLSCNQASGGRPVRHDEGSDAISAGRLLTALACRTAGWDEPCWPIDLDGSHRDVEIVTVKPADRGRGTIVRLRSWGPQAQPRPVLLELPQHFDSVITSATLVDGRERDLETLEHESRRVALELSGHLASVRLITERR